MKRQLATLMLLVFGLGIVATGCGGNKAEAPAAKDNKPAAADVSKDDGSWARVQKAGVIKVGLDDAYPPMGFHDSKTNELTGFDVEMAKLIGDKLGVPFKFEAAEWNSIVPSLISGKFDTIISGMNMWPERKAEVNFVPYGIASQYMVVKADYAEGAQAKDITFFKDKKVATQMGSTAAKVLTALDFAEGKNLVLYKDFPTAFLDLDNGRVQAVITDSFNATEMVKDGKYKIVGAPVIDPKASKEDESDKIGIALSKKDVALQAKIQGAVNELIADGTLGELSKKWISGTDITEGLKADAVKAVEAAKTTK